MILCLHGLLRCRSDVTSLCVLLYFYSIWMNKSKWVVINDCQRLVPLVNTCDVDSFRTVLLCHLVQSDQIDAMNSFQLLCLFYSFLFLFLMLYLSLYLFSIDWFFFLFLFLISFSFFSSLFLFLLFLQFCYCFIYYSVIIDSFLSSFSFLCFIFIVLLLFYLFYFISLFIFLFIIELVLAGLTKRHNFENWAYGVVILKVLVFKVLEVKEFSVYDAKRTRSLPPIMQ